MLLGLVGCGFDTSLDDGGTPLREFELLKAVSLGEFGASNYACAVSSSDSVYCWGTYQPGREDWPVDSSAHYGQERQRATRALRVNGLPSIKQVAQADSRACALDYGGRVWCWGDPPMPSETDIGGPLMVDGLPSISQISAGVKHHCALDDGGSVWCWGDNNHGQGVPNGPKTVFAPTVVKGLEPLAQLTAGP